MIDSVVGIYEKRPPKRSSECELSGNSGWLDYHNANKHSGIISKTYSLELGGIKIESPKCIAKQISPFCVVTMRGTVRILDTKKPDISIRLSVLFAFTSEHTLNIHIHNLFSSNFRNIFIFNSKL